MVSLEQLNEASFKGISFPCNETSTSVGRNQVKHRFINSDINHIEDLGLEPRVYRLTAIITSDDYFNLRDRLFSAIEEGGKGVLIHPFYGRIENAVARPISVEETVSTLGSLEIPLVFDLDESEGIPVKSSVSLSEITQKKEVFLQSVSANIANNFSVSTSNPDNFQAASSLLNSFVDSIDEFVDLSTIPAGFLNGFRAKVFSFKESINSLIQAPADLGEQLTGLINEISNIFSSNEDIFASSKNFSSFGDSSPSIKQNTLSRQERLKNQTILNQSIQSSALSVSYEASAGITYETVREVDEASKELEQSFVKIDDLDVNSLSALGDLRATTQEFLNDQRLSVKRVVTVNVNKTPARILAYNFYGDSSLGKNLATLNKEINVSYVDGDIEILTQ